ncbi:MAG: hypothetical protein ACKOKF_07100, partial [Bacteroidota bacterium]
MKKTFLLSLLFVAGGNLMAQQSGTPNSGPAIRATTIKVPRPEVAEIQMEGTATPPVKTVKPTTTPATQPSTPPVKTTKGNESGTKNKAAIPSTKKSFQTNT